MVILWFGLALFLLPMTADCYGNIKNTKGQQMFIE